MQHQHWMFAFAFPLFVVLVVFLSISLGVLDVVLSHQTVAQPVLTSVYWQSFSQDEFNMYPHKDASLHNWLQSRSRLMRLRIAEKERVCQMQGKNESVNLSRFVVNKRHQLVGCVMNKVASTSLNHAFLRLLRTRTMAKILPQSLTSLIAYLRSKYFLKFIFVRDPMDRLASCYSDKFITNKSPSLANFRKTVKKRAIKLRMTTSDKVNETVTFDEFLRTMVLRGNESATNFARHWAPYSLLCSPCSINYDFIGKLETGYDDFTFLWKISGLDTEIPLPWAHRELTNPMDSAEQRNAKLSKLYQSVPRATLVKVYQHYKLDYALFGYNFNRVLKLAGQVGLSPEEL